MKTQNNMKLQIIETEDYILAVSDGKIKQYNWCINLDNNYIFQATYTDVNSIYAKNVSCKVNGDFKKIIAYQPKGNAKELDLPLLPEMVVEDDVEKSYYIENSKDWDKETHERHGDFLKEDARIYAKGHKAATKVYSEADLSEAIKMAVKGMLDSPAKGWTTITDEIIQSIKQPKTPEWFVAETENKLVLNLGIDVYDPNTHVVSNELKTTIINGKTYCVGCYLCD